MAALRSLFSDIVQRRSRLFWIAFSIFLLLVAVKGVELFALRSTEQNWDDVRARAITNLSAEVTNAFGAYQREAIHAAKRLAAMPEILSQLAAARPVDRRLLFTALQRVGVGPEMSLEIYSSRGTLLTWWGRSSGAIRFPVTAERETSFVHRGPIYSYLSIVVPIQSEMDPLGYAVVHRVFDVNYPFSNRFISSAGFTETFPQQLGIAARYDFSGLANETEREGVITIPLRGVTGAIIGHALVEAPRLSTALDDIRQTTQRWWSFLGAVALALLALILWRTIHQTDLFVLHIVGATVSLWLLRFAWFWIDFPSAILSGGIFDPRFFASPFGFGIARSVGELLITSVFLCINLIYLAVKILPEIIPVKTDGGRIGRMSNVLAIPVLPLLAGLFFLMHRGFAAVVRSAVYDSTLVYNDPTSVVPPAELGVMLLNMILIGTAVAVGSVLILAAAVRLMRLWFSRNFYAMAAIIVGFGVVNFTFDLLNIDLLSTTWARFLVFFGAAALTYYLLGSWYDTSGPRERPGRLRLNHGVFAVAAAVALLLPQLDEQIHRKERSSIELLASELSRPVDAWLTFVLDQALDEMSGREVVDAILLRDSEILGNLAFSQWAKSILSREGYNCSIAITEVGGKVLSSFNVGLRPTWPLDVAAMPAVRPEVPTRLPITIREQSGVFGRRIIYSGSAPMYGPNGELIGAVVVDISAGEQAFFRGEAPPILRTHGREEVERHLRTLVISEYVDGALAYTTSDEIPHQRRMHEATYAVVRTEGSLWVDESIDGKRYETLYRLIDRGGEKKSVLAVSRAKNDWRWHVFDFLRLILFYALIGSVVVFLGFGFLALRGSSYRLSFRMKLVVAFFIVSLVPVVLIAYYNREFTIERANESIVERLSAETATLRTRIMAELFADRAAGALALAKVNDLWCEELAAEMGTDFSLYVDGREHGSSKPELFKAEILDRRLSGAAFQHVALEEKGFFVENQMIGNFTYLVGFRPIISPGGSLLGVLAVPTLYKQVEIAEELARRNALLFGAYTIVLMLALAVGTAFANQISSPIRQLIAATRRIAGGDLDFRLPARRADEIGELHQAFNTMTEDLKRNREALLKAEREMAWKEMAKQVAHEIKNPLTPIKLSIQHLRQAYHPARSGDKRFGELLEKVSRTIIDQISALSRIASEFAHFGRMPDRRDENVDLEEVLRESAKLFEEYKNVQIRFRLISPAPAVRADREELRRAFINILRNAVQAMEERGSIDIDLECREHAIHIRFSDSGPGIAEEIRHRLFEPNFSTKTDGMGLGLAIVKKTVDDLRGSVHISSGPGKGTTVTITLPVVISTAS